MLLLSALNALELPYGGTVRTHTLAFMRIHQYGERTLERPTESKPWLA